MKLRTKILIITLSILVLSIILSIAVQYFYKNKEDKTFQKSMDNIVEQSQLSTNETSNIKKVINETIQFPQQNSDKIILCYYNPSKEVFYQTNLETKKSLALLPFEKIIDLENAVWNSSCEKVLTKKRLEDNQKIYDIKNNSNFNASPNSPQSMWISDNQLISYFHNNENQTNKLVILNSKGEIIETVINLEASKEPFYIKFIGNKNNKIYYTLNLTPESGNFLYELNLDTKENNKILNSSITSANISPDGTKIIYDIYENLEFTHFLFDLNTQENKQININTEASNILWSNDSNNIYLIINTQETTDGAQGYTYFLFDKIDKFSLPNNKTEQTINVANQGKYGAENFFLSADETKLYFTNFENSQLYSIDLK